MSKPVIVFDLDDTLFETREWFEKYLNVMGVAYPQTDKFHIDEFVDPKLIQFALDQGSFMTEAKPVEGAQHYINRLIAAGYTTGFCTHRGYHPKGGEKTIQGLYKWDLMIEGFEGVVLDSKVYPCKMKFLDTLHSKYVLIEDKPTAVRTAKGQVIIYDRPWNRNITNAPRIYGLDGLMPAIENLTWPN